MFGYTSCTSDSDPIPYAHDHNYTKIIAQFISFFVKICKSLHEIITCKILSNVIGSSQASFEFSFELHITILSCNLIILLLLHSTYTFAVLYNAMLLQCCNPCPVGRFNGDIVVPWTAPAISVVFVMSAFYGLVPLLIVPMIPATKTTQHQIGL